ncbi:MAG: hypothetical protein ING75_03635 [Rhodocyclaceae bacterium]|nr:hypothetical protein [Rhodocyclaceae bacterium]
MTYRLSSGRRYLNGELVDPPQLGPWTPTDLDPIDGWDDLWDDLVTAGLLDLECEDDDEWGLIERWLDSLCCSSIPLMFLIERCCGEDELLSQDMIDTRLKDFPAHWRSACLAAIGEAPEWLGDEILVVVAWAVRIERARRLAEPRIEEPLRSTLTFFRPG